MKISTLIVLLERITVCIPDTNSQGKPRFKLYVKHSHTCLTVVLLFTWSKFKFPACLMMIKLIHFLSRNDPIFEKPCLRGFRPDWSRLSLTCSWLGIDYDSVFWQRVLSNQRTVNALHILILPFLFAFENNRVSCDVDHIIFTQMPLCVWCLFFERKCFFKSVL